MGSSAMGASVLRNKIKAAGFPDVKVTNAAIANLTSSSAFVASRMTARAMPTLLAVQSPDGRKHRMAYDAKGTNQLPGTLAEPEIYTRLMRELGVLEDEALEPLRAALVETQQSDHAFVDLRAVVHATAGKDHCNFFAHGLFSRFMALNVY